MPKITQHRIDRLEPGPSDCWLWDTEVPGFGVRASPAGKKTYVARYRTLAGQNRRHRIARCCDISPEAAREFARSIFAQVAAGKDPLADRRPPPTENTVAGLFEAYIANLRARGIRSAGEVERALLLARNNAASALGSSRPASDITPAEIVAYLATLYAGGARGAADKHRSYIGSAYSWAIRSANDYRVANRRNWGISRNPVDDIARDPGATAARDRNLTVVELRAVWQACSPGSPGMAPETAACVRTLIACGQRVQETLRMEVGEVDLRAGVWRIPAHKTKGGSFPHAVFLPDPIIGDLELMASMRRSGLLLPGRGGAMMDHRAINRALARLAQREGLERFQARDLRRTWKSRAHDAGIDRFTRDLVQQHSRGDTGSIYYDRACYEPQMRAAMQRWGAWIQENLTG